MRRLAIASSLVLLASCTNDFESFDFGPGGSDASAGGGGLSGTGGGTAGSGGGVAGSGGGVAGSGGVGTGGTSTGGVGTGGVSTGGVGTGGVGTGGVSTGGVSTGGVSTGGVSTGGVSTGGVGTGGVPTGGTGGVATGGTGGVATGGTGGTGGTTGLPTCETTYGSITGVSQVCAQTATTCDLRYSSNTSSCTKICLTGGGVCINAYNNSGTCGRGPQIGCDDSSHFSAICVCSRGGGTGQPCTSPQTCQAGVCS